MTAHDWAVFWWYMWHGGIVFLVILGVTAVVEHFMGEDR